MKGFKKSQEEQELLPDQTGQLKNEIHYSL